MPILRVVRPDPAGPTLLRCPACAAAVRPGAPWCTQCYAGLQEPPQEPLQEPPPGPAPAPRPEPAAAPDAPAWPCTACGARNPLEAAACLPCGTPFLGRLRDAEPPLLVLPVVGDLAALSRTRRLGLAAGVAVAVAVLVLLLGLLAG